MKPKNKIHQEGWQHCDKCNEITLHLPKLGAALAGKRVCSKCYKENPY